jgi:hypothetical protein
MPKLPITPAKPRRLAWRKVTEAKIDVQHVYHKKQRDIADTVAKRCSEAAGVEFYVEECLY